MEELNFIMVCLEWMAAGLIGYASVLYAKSSMKGKKLATAKLGNELIGMNGNMGMQISKENTLSKKSSKEHIAVIAKTRAGKTTSIFIPNLLQNHLRGSIIVSDPKEEIYNLTSKYQKSIGRKVILYKPMEGTVEYNPLQNCKNEREIFQLSQSLLINGSLTYELKTGRKSGGAEWLQMAQPLLTASLLDQNTIPKALGLILSKSYDELDQYFLSKKQSVKTQYNIFKTSLESPKTAASIINTLVTNLSLFTDNLKINHSDFTAEQLRQEETILYISYPEQYANYLSPLMASIYSQLISHLIESKGLDIYFMFDEFCNIGQLSNFSTTISTAASRDIGFLLCLQSITQLKQLYGVENALSILNNCTTKIFLPGLSDVDSLRYGSELCGEEEIEILENERTHKVKKPLFTMDEIRRLKDKTELIISNNKSPIVANQNIYYEQKKYLEVI